MLYLSKILPKRLADFLGLTWISKPWCSSTQFRRHSKGPEVRQPKASSTGDRVASGRVPGRKARQNRHGQYTRTGAPRKRTRPVRNHFLELAEQFYRISGSIEKWQSNAETLSQRQFGLQAEIDAVESRLLFMSTDTRVDHSTAMSYDEEFLVARRNTRNQELDYLRECEDRLEELTTTLSDVRRRFYDVVLDFNDECLADDFDSQWSLSEASCTSLRICKDQYEAVERSTVRIRQLRLEMSRLRTTEWQHNREIQSYGAQSDDGSNTRNRLDKCKEEIERIQEDIKDREYALDLQKQRLSQIEDRLLQRCIRPLLVRLNRLEQMRSGSASSRRSVGSNSGISASQSSGSSFESGQGDNSAGGEGGPVNACDPRSDPQADYHTKRSVLGREQVQFSEDQRRHRQGLLSHLMAFQNSNPEKYEALVARRLEAHLATVRQAETDFINSRQRLRQAGLQPSASEQREGPDRLHGMTRRARTEGREAANKPPSDEAFDGRRVLATDRRRTNEWRASVQPQSPAARSMRQTPVYRVASRSPTRSSSAPLSHRRNQRLRDYNRERDHE